MYTDTPVINADEDETAPTVSEDEALNLNNSPAYTDIVLEEDEVR